MDIRRFILSVQWAAAEWSGNLRAAFLHESLCRGESTDCTQLEPRLLYSASPLPIDLLQSEALAPAENLQGSGIQPPDSSAATDSSVDSAAAFSQVLTADRSTEPILPQDSTAQVGRNEVVFVDSNVTDFAELLEAIEASTTNRQIEIVVLEADRDGVAQITEELMTRRAVDAVHLLSHGHAGAIRLGATWLNNDNIAHYSAQIGLWQDALSNDADLMLYGCDVASATEGQALLEELSQLAGCDVAASEDTTGHSALGGDWDLEFEIGNITSTVLCGSDHAHLWQGKLAVLVVTSTADDGSTGTLRWAIDQANSSAGTDHIFFNLGSVAPHEIHVSSLLPTITDTVIIDATTQPGFTSGGPPVVVVDGNDLAGDAFRFTLGANGSSIRGLVVRDFAGGAINIASGVSGVEIVGNYLGAFNTLGGYHASEQFGGTIVVVDGNNNTIGGPNAADRNVITGGLEGVLLRGIGASQNLVAGNYIGTNPTATTVRQHGTGVRIAAGATSNQVGGMSPDFGNTIAGDSGNAIEVSGEDSDNNRILFNLIGVTGQDTSPIGVGGMGVSITGGADGTQVWDNVIAMTDGTGVSVNGNSINTEILRNRIGTDPSGQYDWGTGGDGILIAGGASGTTIGRQGDGNQIAFSGLSGSEKSGVTILAGSAGNQISGNSIYESDQLAIDLGGVSADGFTHNDLGDSDTGGNNRQNSATLSSAEFDGTQLRVKFSTDFLEVGPTYTIEFFANSSDSTSNAQAQRYLFGRTSLLAATNYDFLEAGISVTPGELVTATITNEVTGDTSELSLPVAVRSTSALSSPPSSLEVVRSTSGGLWLNSGTANDAYLSSAPASSLFSGLTQFTAEMQLTLEASPEFPQLFDYATDGQPSELSLAMVNQSLVLSLGGSVFNFANDYSVLRDGQVHGVAVTWDNSGQLALYLDGQLQEQLSGIQVGYTISGGGLLVVGNDQDVVGGDFQAKQSMGGILHDLRFFSDVRTATEVAAYTNADVPTDEQGLIAHWAFDQLSRSGVVVDRVAGHDLTVMHVVQSGFVSGTPALLLSVSEDVTVGDVVGSLQAEDIDRQALILALLSADSRLRYDDVTGKFYKLVETAETWNMAQSIAIGSQLNGVAGQLVTIGSAHEQTYVQSIGIEAALPTLWLGGSDANVEGQWQWYDGASADVQFADATGASVNGHFAHFASGAPDGGLASNGLVLAVSSGDWNDTAISGPHAYIVEWDADSVLDNAGPIDEQPIVYQIVGQTPAGAFAIDSDSGVITVANPAQIDYSVQQTHMIQVQAIDVQGNTLDLAFKISVEAPLPPVITSGGGGDSATVAMPENSTVVTTVAADVYGARTISYSLAVGGDANLFGIDSSTGELAFLAPPDFETPTDSDGNNVYVVTVQADDTLAVDQQTLYITVTGLNEAPSLTDLNGGNQFVEGGVPVIIDSNLTIADPELDQLGGGLGDYNRFTISIARSGGANPEDQFGFQDAAGMTRVGGQILKHGTVIASFDDSVAGQLRIEFTNSHGEVPTTADVNTVARQINYRNASSTPPASLDLRWVINDNNDGFTQGSGGALAASGLAAVSSKDIPQLDVPSPGPLNFTEQTPLLVAAEIQLSDNDSANLQSAQLSISGGFELGADQLLVTDSLGLTANWNASSGTLTLAGVASLADYQSVIRSVQFANGSEQPSDSQRSIEIVVSDGEFQSNRITQLIDVTPVNDAPLVDVNIGVTTSEGSSQTLTNAMLREGDVDDGDVGSSFRIDATPTHGVLTLAGSPLGVGDTFTQQDLDDLLIVYQHNGSETLADSFGFTLSDGGEDGALPVSGLFEITIVAVNDHAVSVPVDTAPAVNQIQENAAAGLSVNLQVASVDEDAGDSVTYSLTNDAGGLFQIDTNTGEVTVAGAIDRESLGPTLVVGVRAHSSDGSFADASFSIDILDKNESGVSPVIDVDPTSDLVAANAGDGAYTGLIAQAIDPDATDSSVTYQLIDDAGGRFTIDSATGRVTVLDASLLDHSVASSHLITVSATSADGSSQTAVFNIAVAGAVGSRPVATTDGGYTTEESTALIVDAQSLLANDFDIDGDTLTAILVSGVSHGSLVLNSDGTFTYLPNEGFTGIDTFQYAAFDGTHASDPVSVEISVLIGEIAIYTGMPPAGGPDSDDEQSDGPEFSFSDDVPANLQY